MYFFKLVLDAVASPFGTRASARRPSLARGTGKYRLSRWRPSGSPSGTATVFGIAQAIRSTGEDASDRSLRQPSGDENAKSFGEGERLQWSTFAGLDSLGDQAAGDRTLRAGSLAPSEGEQATRRR